MVNNEKLDFSVNFDSQAMEKALLNMLPPGDFWSTFSDVPLGSYAEQKKPDWLARFILKNYFSRHLNSLLNYISTELAAVHSPKLTTQNNDEQLKAWHKLLNIDCISLEKLKEAYEKKASQLAALYTERRPATPKNIKDFLSKFGIEAEWKRDENFKAVLEVSNENKERVYWSVVTPVDRSLAWNSDTESENFIKCILDTYLPVTAQYTITFK